MRYWSTYYIRLGTTRTTRAPCQRLAPRALMRGRDECASSEERTQPRYIVPTFHRVHGVGGLLKNHQWFTVYHCGWPRLRRRLIRQPRKLSWRTCMLTPCGSTGNACSVTRQVHGRVRCEVLLASHMMITAKNTLLNASGSIMRPARSRFSLSPGHWRPLHDEHVRGTEFAP